MRILFGATPVPGHLLPLLPLADAAVDEGHEVAFLTAGTMAPFLDGRTLLPAGAGFEEIASEASARSSYDTRHPGKGAAEMFAGARVDLTWDDALPTAQAFAPDMLVGEWVDFVTPLLAAQFDIPWIAHSIGGPLPVEFTDAMADRSGQQHQHRGLRPHRRTALLDPCPVPLRGPADPPVESDRIEIRPTAHRDRVSGMTAGAPIPAAGDRPLILVTTGTSIGGPDLVNALASSLVGAGADVLVTAAPHADLERPHVHAMGFVPLADLLPRVDVVVGTAGSGTLLAALAHGIPSILFPQIADQPANAARAVAQHAAIEIGAPEQAGPALSTLLADERYRAGARHIQAAIARMPSPADAFGRVLAALSAAHV